MDVLRGPQSSGMLKIQILVESKNKLHYS